MTGPRTISLAACLALSALLAPRPSAAADISRKQQLQYLEERLDPTVAFVLGAQPFLPAGLGHLYTDDWWTRGATFAAAQLLGVVSFPVADILIGDDVEYRNPKLTLFGTLSVLLIVTKIWESSDAYSLAKRHNLDLLRRLERPDTVDPPTAAEASGTPRSPEPAGPGLAPTLSMVLGVATDRGFEPGVTAALRF